MYPGVPIELIVSVGTGKYQDEHHLDKNGDLSWKTLIDTMVSSSTDTESVHDAMSLFFPSDKYIRLNPPLSKKIAIDDRDPETVNYLRESVGSYFDSIDNNEESSERLNNIIQIL